MGSEKREQSRESQKPNPNTQLFDQRFEDLLSKAKKALQDEMAAGRLGEDEFNTKLNKLLEFKNRYELDLRALETRFTVVREQIISESRKKRGWFREGLSGVKRWAQEKRRDGDELLIGTQLVKVWDFQGQLKGKQLNEISSEGLAQYFEFLQKKGWLNHGTLEANFSESTLVELAATWTLYRNGSLIPKEDSTYRSLQTKNPEVFRIANEQLSKWLEVFYIPKKLKEHQDILINELGLKGKDVEKFKGEFSKILGNAQAIPKELPLLIKKYSRGKKLSFEKLQLGMAANILSSRIEQATLKSEHPNEQEIATMRVSANVCRNTGYQTCARGFLEGRTPKKSFIAQVQTFERAETIKLELSKNTNPASRAALEAELRDISKLQDTYTKKSESTNTLKNPANTQEQKPEQNKSAESSKKSAQETTSTTPLRNQLSDVKIRKIDIIDAAGMPIKIDKDSGTVQYGTLRIAHVPPEKIGGYFASLRTLHREGFDFLGTSVDEVFHLLNVQSASQIQSPVFGLEDGLEETQSKQGKRHNSGGANELQVLSRIKAYLLGINITEKSDDEIARSIGEKLQGNTLTGYLSAHKLSISESGTPDPQKFKALIPGLPKRIFIRK